MSLDGNDTGLRDQRDIRALNLCIRDVGHGREAGGSHADGGGKLGGVGVDGGWW